jgi:hypothetical protein
MRASDRSYAIQLHENIGAITAWRAGLSDRERGRLIGAQANVKRWRASLVDARRCASEEALETHKDLKRQAAAAWRRFVSCARLLPPDQAMTLWQTVAAEVATHHIRVYTRTSRAHAREG